LVTGCAGFIGAKVTEFLLADGHAVVGVDNLNDAYDVRLKQWRLAQIKDHPDFTFHHLDMCDRVGLHELFKSQVASRSSQFDAVINLAARAGVRQSVANPWMYFETNVTGTLNLLDLCRGFGVQKFVLASTSSLYGANNPRPFQEDASTDGPLSPYVDWFHVEHWPLNPYGGGGGGGGGAAAKDGSCGYHCWWNDPALPSFNHANPAVRAYLLAVARHWIAAGVDGWRLDVPDEVPDDFWREFRAVVRAERPDAWIVGELWRDARPWLQSGLFDGTMNYPLAWAILGWVGARQVPAQLRLPALPEPPYQPLDQAGFRARVEEVLGWYGPAINRCQLNLLDSHDTPRALHVLGGDREALALALLLLFLLPGAPCLYYGTEMGLAGGTEPGCREAMPWDAFPLGAAPPLRPLLAGLSALRRSQPALRSSELAFTGSGHDDLLQLSRGEGPERVWVVINRGLLALPLALPAGATTVLWPPQSVGGPPPRELPPQHGLVLAFPAS